jgi:hypothetical protein
MINDFDDLCLWKYILVDYIWLEIASLFKRPGLGPECSDSELITLALVGECRGWMSRPKLSGVQLFDPAIIINGSGSSGGRMCSSSIASGL